MQSKLDIILGCWYNLPKGGVTLDDKVKFKNRLKVARAELNISQEQLANLAGVSRQTIGSIETGQYCPTAKLALILSKCLHKTFEELFYIEEEDNNV
jgi:putative transcriptional regulator